MAVATVHKIMDATIWGSSMGNRLYLLQYVGCLLAYILCDSRHMPLEGDMQQHLHTHSHTVFVNTSKIIHSENSLCGAARLDKSHAPCKVGV
jgi:hypothetical protein